MPTGVSSAEGPKDWSAPGFRRPRVDAGEGARPRRVSRGRSSAASPSHRGAVARPRRPGAKRSAPERARAARFATRARCQRPTPGHAAPGAHLCEWQNLRRRARSRRGRVEAETVPGCRDNASPPSTAPRCCAIRVPTNLPFAAADPADLLWSLVLLPNSNSSDVNIETRREFLRRVSAASLAALATGAPRHAFRRRQAAQPTGDRRHRHPALDGRRHGAHRDFRSEALLAFRQGMPGGVGALHLRVRAHRARRRPLLRRARGNRQGDGSRHAHPLARRGRPRRRSCTRAISFTGTPATSRRRASPRRISARGLRRNSARKIRSCRLSSSSASASIGAKRRS